VAASRSVSASIASSRIVSFAVRLRPSAVNASTAATLWRAADERSDDCNASCPDVGVETLRRTQGRLEGSRVAEPFKSAKRGHPSRHSTIRLLEHRDEAFDGTRADDGEACDGGFPGQRAIGSKVRDKGVYFLRRRSVNRHASWGAGESSDERECSTAAAKLLAELENRVRHYSARHQRDG